MIGTVACSYALATTIEWIELPVVAVNNEARAAHDRRGDVVWLGVVEGASCVEFRVSRREMFHPQCDVVAERAPDRRRAAGVYEFVRSRHTQDAENADNCTECN